MPTHVRKLRFAMLLLLLLLASSLAFAKERRGRQDEDNPIPIHGQSQVDREKGLLTATGLGLISKQEPDQAKAYLVAYQAAKMDALRNLLMLVDQVQIDSHTLGTNFTVGDDTIRAELKGRLRGAKVISDRVITVGNGRLLELTMSLTMPEEGRSAHEPRPEIRQPQPDPGPKSFGTPSFPKAQRESSSRSNGSWRVSENPSPCPPRSIPSAPPVETGYTSVIIDARGLQLERSMSPQIRRANGMSVWGNVDVDPNWVIEHGIVAYAHSLREANSNSRAGEKPLILRAIGRGEGNYPSDPVLSNADATRLLQANDVGGFLEKYRVIFLVDAEK